MMNVDTFTDIMARFLAMSGKILPDDVTEKLSKLKAAESQPLAKTVYESMFENQRLAAELNRPSCQDTGVINFFVSAGEGFPDLGKIAGALKEAVMKGDRRCPASPQHGCDLRREERRHERRRACSVYPLGYRSQQRYTADTILYGRRRLQPSRPRDHAYALGRVRRHRPVCVRYDGRLGDQRLSTPVGGNRHCRVSGERIDPFEESHPEAAWHASPESERRGNGASDRGRTEQNRTWPAKDVSGSASVMGVHIESAARHPSTISVGINVGCWAHRYGTIVFDKDLNFEILSHKGVTL